MDTRNDKKRSIVLAAVMLTVLVATVAAIAFSSMHRRRGMHQLAIQSEQKKNVGKSVGSNAMVSVGEDGWGTSQTGVYYVRGDPSKCFIIKASPWAAQRGWVLEPSNALSATMISGFGWVGGLNPTRGKVMMWTGSQQRKEVKFVYYGSTITIDGAMYQRRPKQAPWQCAPQMTTKIPVYAKSFGAANCQWLMWNKQTTGFVIYYSKGPGTIVAGGGGYYDEAKNDGQVGGYHHSGALDGVYRVTKQANPPVFLLWSGATRFAGGAWDFIQLSTCVDPGYPKVTQTVGPLATYTPCQGATRGTDKNYRVSPTVSWSQAAVACFEDGLVLCSKKEYCPSGTGSKPQLGGLVGDVWAPISDMFQNFVQLADPNRICVDHLTKHLSLPPWKAYGTIATVFRCCQRPAVLSPPLLQLATNDHEYRFILDGTYQQAEVACKNDGMHLCTLLEYCPNGSGAIPLLGVVPGGDVWAPIKDSRYPTGNNWVQVSDIGRICHTHADLYNARPPWPSCCTPGKKTPFRCCH